MDSLRLKDVTYPANLHQSIDRVRSRLCLGAYGWGLEFHAAWIDAMMFGLNDGQDRIHRLIDLRIRI